MNGLPRNKAVRYIIATVAGATTGLVGGMVALIGWQVYLFCVRQNYGPPLDLSNNIMDTIAGLCYGFGVLIGMLICLDRADLPRSATAGAYTLLATLALFAAIFMVHTNLDAGPTALDRIINLAPLLVWSLALELRAVYLIRHPQP